MKLNRNALSSKKGVLLKNTIMLYIMQFSTYLLIFIVVPYETRVLGETYYGKLGVATAIMVYFQLVIDLDLSSVRRRKFPVIGRIKPEFPRFLPL